MSATKELVSYIKEYTEFLDFVNKTNPEIIRKWKSRSAVVTSDSSNANVDETTNPRNQLRYGYEK